MAKYMVKSMHMCLHTGESVYANPQMKYKKQEHRVVDRWVDDKLGMKLARDYDNWRKLMWGCTKILPVPPKVRDMLKKDGQIGTMNKKTTVKRDLDLAFVTMVPPQKLESTFVQDWVYHNQSDPDRPPRLVLQDRTNSIGKRLVWPERMFDGTNHPFPHALAYETSGAWEHTARAGAWLFKIQLILEQDELTKLLGANKKMKNYMSLTGHYLKTYDALNDAYYNNWKEFMYRCATHVEVGAWSFGQLNETLKQNYYRFYTLQGGMLRMNTNSEVRYTLVENPPDRLRDICDGFIPPTFYKIYQGFEAFLRMYYNLCKIGYSRYSPHLPDESLGSIEKKPASTFQQSYDMMIDAGLFYDRDVANKGSWDFVVDRTQVLKHEYKDEFMDFDRFANSSIRTDALSQLIHPFNYFTQAVYGFVRYAYFRACLHVSAGRITSTMVPDLRVSDEFQTWQHGLKWLVANKLLMYDDLSTDYAGVREYVEDYLQDVQKEEALQHMAKIALMIQNQYVTHDPPPPRPPSRHEEPSNRGGIFSRSNTPTLPDRPISPSGVLEPTYVPEDMDLTEEHMDLADLSMKPELEHSTDEDSTDDDEDGALLGGASEEEEKRDVVGEPMSPRGVVPSGLPPAVHRPTAIRVAVKNPSQSGKMMGMLAIGLILFGIAYALSDNND